jgi:hypothetical protein
VRQEGDPLADTILSMVQKAGYRNVFLDSIPTDLKNASRVNLWAADDSFSPIEQQINLAVRPFSADENEEISDSAIFVAAYSGRVSWLRPSTEFLNALETVLKARPTTDEVQRMYMGTLSISTWLKKYAFSFYIRPIEIDLEQKALGARMAEQAA